MKVLNTTTTTQVAILGDLIYVVLLRSNSDFMDVIGPNVSAICKLIFDYLTVLINNPTINTRLMRIYVYIYYVLK